MHGNEDNISMTSEILSELRKITPEEKRILNGAQEIEKDIYMDSSSNVIDCRRLLENGKLIQVRPHTRFVHFPEHTHNYVELIYMCSGQTHHIINGEKITLGTGELLFLNQNARQEILPAGEEDIAVNFIILPEFFDYALKMMEDEENLIRNFLISCLKSEEDTVSYLYFKVAEVLTIQNLMENLIWTIKNTQTNKRSINQVTMGLLFLHLLNYSDKIEVGKNNFEQELLLAVYRFIEENYKNGELSELAENLHFDLCWISRMIKKLAGRTYTELLQAKRLSQAVYLLVNSKLTIDDIAVAVGYDNISYFHRLFKGAYNMTPREYRLSRQK